MAAILHIMKNNFLTKNVAFISSAIYSCKKMFMYHCHNKLFFAFYMLGQNKKSSDLSCHVTIKAQESDGC